MQPLEITTLTEISKPRSETADVRVRRKKGNTIVWVNKNGRRPQRKQDLEVLLTDWLFYADFFSWLCLTG